MPRRSPALRNEQESAAIPLISIKLLVSRVIGFAETAFAGAPRLARSERTCFLGPMADLDHDLDALNRIAQRMDDVFRIGLPDAPGLAFVAAKFRAAAQGEGGRPFSAGAADVDPERAYRRCIGEAAETLSQFLRPGLSPTSPSDGLLASEADAMIALCGPEGDSGGWLPATRLDDGSRSSVPATLCLRDVGDGERIGRSLGCAAGITAMAATRSALLELVERDAVALWWRGDLPAGFLPRETLGLAGAEEMLHDIRAERTERRTWFLDLTTDLGIPVVAALSASQDGSGMAFGFAARETLAGCIRPALYELAQMELGNRLVRLKSERGGEAALNDQERRQQERISILSAGMKPFDGEGLLKGHVLDAEEDDGIASRRIVDRLETMGVFVHAVDLTDPDLGVPVVKIVAPGLQAEPGGIETERLRKYRARFGLAQDDGDRPDIL